jgi:hypothetical protein
MQVGDLVCVVLGCDQPVVLREAIYNGKLPAKYQRANPVIHGRQYRGSLKNSREGYESALYDTDNNVIVNNPVVVLEDAGIKVDRYQISAFQVHVL